MITVAFIYKCSIKHCAGESTAQVYRVAPGCKMPQPSLPFGWISITHAESTFDLCAECAERGMPALRDALEGKPVEGIQD